MGYGVVAYRVELDYLFSLFKNNNERIRTFLINAGQSSHCTDIHIVKELVEEGKASNTEMGHEYLYAIEGILSKVTVPMYARFWSPVRVSVFYLLEEYFEELTDVFPFQIPNPSDFPTVWVMKKNQMTSTLLERLKLDVDDDELFGELQSWINQALENDEDLILYYY